LEISLNRELGQNLKPEGAGLKKMASLLRPTLNLTLLFFALTLAYNNLEQMEKALFFKIAGGVCSSLSLVAIWILSLIYWVFTADSEPLKFLERLIPFGTPGMRVHFGMIIISIGVVRLFGRVLRRAYINNKVKIFLIEVFLFADVVIFTKGGKEAVELIVVQIVSFIKTF
jgi:hypothetical protein